MWFLPNPPVWRRVAMLLQGLGLAASPPVLYILKWAVRTLLFPARREIASAIVRGGLAHAHDARIRVAFGRYRSSATRRPHRKLDLEIPPERYRRPHQRVELNRNTPRVQHPIQLRSARAHSLRHPGL
jgi:hypothetical protein